MKKNVRNLLTAIVGGLTFAMLGAAARADLVGGTFSVSTTVSSWLTNWPTATPGLPPQYTSINNANLTGFTGQGQPSTGSGATATVLSETFSPVVPFTLTGIGIMAGAGSVNTITMHLYDVTTNLTSNNGTRLNGSGASYPTNVATFVDLLGNGSGLPFVFTNTSSGMLQFFFALTNGTSNDRIALQTNHNYAVEFSTPVTANSNPFLWFRNSTADSGGQGMGSHDAAITLNSRLTLASLGLAGGAPRTFAVALYSTNYVFPGATTNIVTTVLNPVPAAYGPPTVWPYTAGISMPTFTDNINTDEAFGANTVMGETFLATRDFQLRNFYFAVQGTTNSGNYVLVLNDLGTSSPGSSFNPAPFNSGSNMLSHPTAAFPQYWSFTPSGLTNKTIVKFKLVLADQVLFTAGHYYFLGFAYASGSNDMVLERTTGGASYANGAAYKGSSSSVANNGFAASVRNFLMAVDVLNPNLVVGVTNATLTTSWPTVAGQAYGGLPVIQIPVDPFSDGGLGLNDDPVNDNAMGTHNTAVLEGIASGRAISMSFIATNDFNLGAIAFRQRGIGSSNCLFTLAVYNVTNTFLSQGTNGSTSKWPFNFQPNIDTSPKGIPIFGTNVDFYYTTNAAGLGTNDQVMILTLNNPANQVLLHSNQVYTVEITADTLGQNANTAGLFLWVRDVGQIQSQIELFPDIGDGNQFDGFRTNAVSGGAAFYIIPRGLNRTFTDPEQFAGAIAGNARDLVMAVYAAPPTVTISTVSRSGNSVTLNWNSNGPSNAGATYSVLRKINLTDVSWTTLVSGLASPTYTDNTATATTGFYQITSP